MKPLRIRDITLHTTTRGHQYTFSPGLNIIEGPSGTGKTSLLELIKYALGGNAEIMETVQQHVHSVSCRIYIGNRQISLQRSMRHGARSHVDVHDDLTNERIGHFSTENRPPTLSDLLLNALGLPTIEVPASLTTRGKPPVRLTFNDIWSYIYLQQSELDRSVVRHKESYREPKRRAAFELLFGLIDETTVRLQTERDRVKKRLDELRQEAMTIRNFLARSGTPDDALQAELTRLTDELTEREAAIRARRQEIVTATTSVNELRDRLARLASDVAAANRAAKAAAEQITAREAILAQLAVDHSRVRRSNIASDLLGGIQYRVCPRCLQPLTEREIPETHCGICLQPEPAPRRTAETTQADTTIRLEEQMAETRELLVGDQEALRKADEAHAAAERAIAETQAELDARTRHVIAPHAERLAEATAAHAALKERITAVTRDRAVWSRLTDLDAEVERTDARYRQLGEEITERTAAHGDRNSRLERFSGYFAQHVRDFRVPWFRRTAHIDTTTFLPVVDSTKFDKLQPTGGIKTLVNLAYHLAALTYALYDDTVDLPSLLIIDSPRKSLGKKTEDARRIELVYGRIRTLCDAREGVLQFILADSDPPPETAGSHHHIGLSYDRPLIPDIPHPGPGRVKTIGEA